VAIDVRIFGHLRLHAGVRAIPIDAPKGQRRLRDILLELGRLKRLQVLKDVAKKGIREGAPFIILVDGRNCMQLQGLDILVKDGQRISIFPPSGGG